MTEKKITGKSDIKINLPVYIILAAACMIILIPSFGNGFFSDDYSWLLSAKESGGKNAGSIFFEPSPYEYFRPVPGIIFYVMWNIFDGGYLYYRILILILHILTSVLLYHLFSVTGFSRKISALSALIFAVMACHSEALYSVYSINEILAALFTFSGLYIFLSDFRFKNLISVLLFSTAVLSRESAFCFIPLLFLFNLKSKKHRIGGGIKITLSVTAIYTVLRFISYINYAQLYEAGNFSRLQLNPVLFGYKIFHFFINMLFPVKNIFYVTGFEYYEMFRNAIVNPGQNIMLFAVLAAVITVTAFLILIIFFKINKRIFLFPLLVALCGIIIYLPFEGTAERFLYLPSAGIALLIGLFCFELINRRFKLAYPLIIIILLFYSLLNLQRAEVWENASIRTSGSIENIHTLIDARTDMKNILLTEVPSIVNGAFFINQYNINHIWKYHYPGSEINFILYELPEDVSADLILKYSDFEPKH